MQGPADMPIILRTIPLWIIILGLSAVRCVGTDFIISPLPTVPARIKWNVVD